MKAAIFAIGTELTRGELCDTNTCWLSEQLTEAGVDVVSHLSVDDDVERIAAGFLGLGQEVELILSTGGLGPTSDDMTAAAAAAALGVSLRRDRTAEAAIEAKYRRAGRTPTDATRKQADLPEGAQSLENDVGTAPGFRFQIGRAEVYCMPGVPREMRHLFSRHVLPAVGQRVRRTSHQAHIRCIGLPESVVAERLADWDAGGVRAEPGVTLGYRASLGQIEVKVLARAESLDEARRLAEAVASQAKERLGDHVFGGRDDDFPAVVGATLREADLTLALAESCTGGLASKLLSDVPGSSDFLLLSAVTYANAAKERVLGVPSDLLERHGAVSEPVVAAMADGAREVADADLAVSISGVAGPAGGSPEKPVGTVCFGLSQRGMPTHVERRQFGKGRDRVRMLAAQHALALVRLAALGRLARLTLTEANP